MSTFRLEIRRPHGIETRKVKPDGAVGIVEGKCPACGAEPFLVRGSNCRRNVNRDDEYMANGRSVCCNDRVGYLYERVETIFGVEEDEAVLTYGRARVY